MHNVLTRPEQHMPNDRGRQLIAALLISIAVFAGLAALRAAGALQALELLGYDLAITFRSAPMTARSSPVVLVAVTEDDIASMGGWPITDAALSEVLAAIDTYQPRIIGLDIYRDVPVAPGTDAFDATLAALANVIAIYKFSSSNDPGVGPPRVLVDTERVGFSDIVLDAGGVVRRGLAFIDDGQRIGYSFALRLALAYLAHDSVALRPAPEEPDHFALGKTTFAPIEPHHGGYVGADTGGYQFMLDFADLDAGFERYSMGDVLAGGVPKDALRDRIVILGVVAVSVKDAFVTPRGQWGWVVDAGMPGIALHGVITEQFVRAALEGRSPMNAWSEPVEYGVLLLACVVGGLIGLQSRSARRLLVIATGGVALTWAVGYWYFLSGVWAPIVPAATGWVAALVFVTGYLVQRERADRALLQRMYATQTSPEIAETLWARRTELLEGGGFKPQTLEATVLFIDLGGFTSVSERLSPSELMSWVHRFMEGATRVVVEHGGMVDDYFGDGLKANFGAPFPRLTDAEISEDARQAVRCALALQTEVLTLNAARDDMPAYIARVGIHSGTIVVGGVGNVERQKYTSIGDTVNVAARLEALAKEVTGGKPGIVVSDSTASLLGDEFSLKNHGQMALRGRTSSIGVFEVLGGRPQTAHSEGGEHAHSH
jgi:adenylate cyclase